MVVRRADTGFTLTKRAGGRSLAELAPPATRMWIAAALTVAAGVTLLVVRLIEDLTSKPLFEDEGITAWVASRPLPDLLRTTVWERGGAPGHFVLVHLAFAINTSATALRAVSVVFALLTVCVAFDLGRRLGGDVAGVAAAVMASTSVLLTIYGTVGRMYAMFAFAGGLAADLFIRAARRRTAGSAVAAAAAAWLLPAVHPFGAVLVAVEALAALWLWRGRRLRAALPVFAVVLAMAPFAVGDLQLSARVSSGVATRTRLITPRQAAVELPQALIGFAGGFTVAALLLVPLGIAGAWIAVRREPIIAAVSVIPLFGLPLLEMGVRVPGGEGYTTARHLIFALPVWSAFIGVAAARLAAPGRRALTIAIFAVLLAGGAWSATGANNLVLDPRAAPLWADSGTPSELAAPANWLRARIERDDLLFPYSAVYLAAFPQTDVAYSIGHHYPRSVIAALQHVPLPIAHVFVATPVPHTTIDLRQLRAELGTRYQVVRFSAWLLIEVKGPFRSRERILDSIYLALQATRRTVRDPSAELRLFLRLTASTVCVADVSLLRDEHAQPKPSGRSSACGTA